MITIDVDGAAVPALGLGTWRLYEDDCARIVSDAVAMGYRHIDTAQRYQNESAVGLALSRSSVPREDLWLTTKLDMGNATAAAAAASLHESLRRLRTEYVDLLLIHWPEPGTPCEESLTAMAALQAAGLVRHLGVCNFPPSLFARACATTRIVTEQVEYHLLLSQQELRRLCLDRGMFLTAFAPLARGRLLSEPTVLDIAGAHARTPAQIALRWLVQQPRTAAIPKTSSTQRLQENLDIFDFTLSEQEMATLTALGGGTRVVNPPHAPDWERDQPGTAAL